MIRKYFNIFIGFGILVYTALFLMQKYEYRYFDFHRPLELGREFNRSSLEIGKWIKDYAHNSDDQVNVKFFGPKGSLYSYHILGEEKVNTQSPDFWVHWNSLFPVMDNMCDSGDIENLREKHKTHYDSENVKRFSTFDDYMRLVEGLCYVRPEGDIAFMWMHKITRFRKFDCFDNVDNEKIPPTFGSCQIHFVSQKHIFDSLDYDDLVVVGTRFFFLTELLDENSGIEPLYELDYGIDDRAKVYKVRSNTLNRVEGFNLKIGASMKAFFDGFEQEEPGRYQQFKEKILIDALGLDESQIEGVRDYDGQCFKIEDRDYSTNASCDLNWKKGY